MLDCTFELFNGIAQLSLPSNAVNLRMSGGRPIPDNQEVFSCASSNQSVIIEMLESVEGRTPDEAINLHFEDIANTSVEKKSLSDVTVFADNEFIRKEGIFACRASFSIKDEAGLEVNIFLGLIRLKSNNTDILITVNEPITERSTNGLWKSEDVLILALRTLNFNSLDFLNN
ncbi:hypothetical protein ACOME3_003620 [Neoechinorhynchus agilis]